MDRENWLLLCVIFLFFLFFINFCERQRNEEQLIEYISYKDSVKNILYDKDNLIYIQDQYITNSKKEIESLTEKVKGIKNIQSQTKIKQAVRVVHDTLIIKEIEIKKIENKSFLKLPAEISDKNKWYNLAVTIDTLGNSVLDSLEIYGDILHTVGTEDKGFFKNLFTKNNIIVTYKSNNPYFKVDGIKSFALQEKKRINIGLQAGYYLTKDGFQPGIGVGVSYTIVSF